MVQVERVLRGVTPQGPKSEDLAPFHRHFIQTMGPLHEFWLIGLLKNLICYGTLAAVIWILINRLKKHGYLDKAKEFTNNLGEAGFLYRLLIIFAVGHTPSSSDVTEGSAKASSTSKKEANWDWPEYGRLLICVLGLQGAYLTWGIAQERIMTQNYPQLGGGDPERFKDSQFLVFMNRISAFFVAGCGILFLQQATHRAPLYKYSYASFSNIMSSWFQYEALKFIAFPTQVLGKASKIIIVMAMGSCVGKQTYPAHQYVTSLFISLGVGTFLFSRMDEGDNGKHLADSTTTSGFFLMIGYLAFDSFTSNWQGELFKQYKMSSLQMMCGVNLFSSLFTISSLLMQGNFFHSISFIFTHENLYRDIGVLSLCGAIGQLFIFYTIGRFGPVTFTIIMTIRQAAAIFLSCLIYGHKLSALGGFGTFIVFAALLARTYCNRKFGSRPAPRRIEGEKEDLTSLISVETKK